MAEEATIQRNWISAGFQAQFLRIKRLLFKPEYDLTVLEIDPAENPESAAKRRLSNAKPRLAFGLVKISLPIWASMSLGVDLRSAEAYLKEQGYVSK